MNAENTSAALKVRRRELNLTVHAAWTRQGGVKSVRAVCGHDDLDVAAAVKTVHLVHHLKHSALHLGVLTLTAAGTADGINLVEEDDTRLPGPGHLEQLAHHARPLTNVFLHQLGANDADERGVGPVRNGTREQRLARARRSVQEHTFWGVNAEGFEALRLRQRQLDNLADLLDLVLGAANVCVCHVGLLLDLHHRDARVDLRGEGNLNLVLLALDAHAHALFNISGADLVAERNNVLRILTDVDKVLGLVRIRVDNLCAARNLQTVLLSELLITHQVPVVRSRQAEVHFLDAGLLVQFFNLLLDELFKLLDLFRVRTATVCLQQSNVILVEGYDGLLVVFGLFVLEFQRAHSLTGTFFV
eukprot:PhM_4_TR10737/c0_g1_i1/m.81868